MTRVQLALASAVLTLLSVAGGGVAVRTSAAPAALAFVVGGRASAAVASSAVAVPASLPPSGPRSAPLSNPAQLEPALAALGYRLPPGAKVYGARIGRDAGGLTYEDFQAGGGALASDFWPASSIKVLAAVGALEFIGQAGFTGAATVTLGDEPPRTVQSIYDDAIRSSDNGAYDDLVLIAGVNWLNQQFLTAARGFPLTVIQKSYLVAGNLLTSPAMTLAEGNRKLTVAARTGTDDPSCPAGNCSNLYEMSESVRRVVFHNEIRESERFRIAPADVAGLTADLLAAEGWFEPAVAQVLGPSAHIYGKPGDVSTGDCLDVTMIEWAGGRKLLLAATVPEAQGGCPALVTLATYVLRIVSR